MRQTWTSRVMPNRLANFANTSTTLSLFMSVPHSSLKNLIRQTYQQRTFNNKIFKYSNTSLIYLIWRINYSKIVLCANMQYKEDDIY